MRWRGKPGTSGIACVLLGWSLGCGGGTVDSPTATLRLAEPQSGEHLLAPMTVVVFAEDLEAATRWYTEVLGYGPYFNEPFYVGFNVGGFELGLQPGGPTPPDSEYASVAYWGVQDLDEEVARITALGASIRTPIENVGGAINLATLIDPFGNAFGLIENPEFPNLAQPLGADVGD